MKRSDAIRKIRTLCERLDTLDYDACPILPLELYLFGSVLTDKPDPGDVDMAMVYRQRLPAAELYHRLVYHEPLPFDQVSTQLRRHMKMIRIEGVENSVERWATLGLFPRAEGVRLLWKRGFDWRAVVDEIEMHPAAWRGPRAQQSADRALEAWMALPAEQRQAQREETIAALAAQARR